MGFKLKNVLKSVGKVAVSPITLGSGLLALGGLTGGGSGNDGGSPAPTGGPRSLKDILSDQTLSYSESPLGPAYEDNSAAYQNALQSGEAMRRREEQATTDNIFEGLQSRGIARSGIALRDVVNQVLGPSAERANSLAAQFGLAQAQDRTDFLNRQREEANLLNRTKLGGRLSSILGYDDAANEMARLGAQQNYEANQRSADRRASRQNALVGGISSVVGSVLGGLCFDAETPVEMAGGSFKPIGKLELGDYTRGGTVLSIRKSYSTDVKNYKGVFVTGSHAVFENGIWKRVGESKYASNVSGGRVVISIITSMHRVYSNGLTFADEQETNLPLWTDPETSLNKLNEAALVEA